MSVFFRPIGSNNIFYFFEDKEISGCIKTISYNFDKDGKEYGKWIDYYENGQLLIEDNYKDGKRDGEGKWIIDGCSYEGEWKLDKMHGEGTYKYLDEVKQGYWFMGRFKRYLDEAMEPCNYIEIIK